MHFEKNHLYHIFNQGNNRQRIFFKEENYLFFLQKIKTHICPFADVLAWCLMPNHFHLMVRVNAVELPTEGFAQSETLGSQNEVLGIRQRTFNESIGIMLRAYTNAINKQEKISGSLFRKATKAECLNCPSGITPSFYNTRSGTFIPVDDPAKHYPQVCFNYIHQNPVKAHLVSKAEDWPFSSYRDVIGVRNGMLINRRLIDELELLKSVFDSKPSDE
ncbi:MAG: hypothetical protein M0P66_06345 [Salinivirgaceae bacterium]|nr:hypothetical protein [Salinivirgaceae bacterium]